jgi:hypothetical protein
VSYVDGSTNTQPPEETPLLELDVEPAPPPDDPLDEPPDDDPFDPLLLDSPLEEPLVAPLEPPEPDDPLDDPPGPTSDVLPPQAAEAAPKRRSAEARNACRIDGVVMDGAHYTRRASDK